MFQTALTRLKSPNNDLPSQWTDLGNKQTALRLLLLPNRIRDRGDEAAHAAGRKLIGESVLAIMDEQQREDMIAIFVAVYGREPVH